MQRQMLKSKIHRATVTGRDPDYVGSITLDPELMRAADLLANEQVHVWDIANGARFVTYAIEAKPGSGTVAVNGAAARLVNEGDKVIVASFGAYDERELETYAPVVVHVDERNRIARVDSRPEVLLDSPLASESPSESPRVRLASAGAGQARTQEAQRGSATQADEDAAWRAPAPPGVRGGSWTDSQADFSIPGELTPAEVLR